MPRQAAVLRRTHARTRSLHMCVLLAHMLCASVLEYSARDTQDNSLGPHASGHLRIPKIMRRPRPCPGPYRQGTQRSLSLAARVGPGREGSGGMCYLLGTTRWLVTDVNRQTARIVSLSEEGLLEVLVGLEMLPAGVYMLLYYATVDQVSEAGSGICRERMTNCLGTYRPAGRTGGDGH